MNEQQLENIQKELFFKLGYKIDLYHFPELREIAIVQANDPLIPDNVIKSYKY